MLDYLGNRNLRGQGGPDPAVIEGRSAVNFSPIALGSLSSTRPAIDTGDRLQTFPPGQPIDRHYPEVSPGVDVLPRGGLQRVVKRGIDIVLAATALFMLLPLLLAVAALIRAETRGPVLFRQNRIGLGNRPFQIYKFRTMTCCDDGQDIRQACRDDPRVTRIGRFLRRSSIDELPQLLNVLVGTMALVGPRPHAVAHHRQYVGTVARYADRHVVRPGITGWAQVKGFRGATPDIDTMRSRVEHDLAYIERWSLALDMMIMAMTLREIFRTENVY